MKNSLVFSILFLASIGCSANNSALDVVESHQRSVASEQMTLDVAQVKDRPFTIQVASHLNELKAIEHVEQLRRKEFHAFYYPNFIKNQVIFKVCVGRFSNEKEAQKFHEQFVKETSESFSVVSSLLSRPGSDHKATQALLRSIQKQERVLASVLSTGPQKSNAQKFYSLQFASVPQEELAKKEIEKAKASSEGLELFYRPTQINGQTWYRLYVGRYSEFQKAEAAKEELKSEAFKSTIVRKLFD